LPPIQLLIMKKFSAILFFIFTIQLVFAQKHQQLPDVQKIKHLLSNQVIAWNNGNIEEYMSGYWKNDSLIFIGKKGITKGWQQTLDNYKKSYPDKSAMGVLQFDIISVELFSKTIAHVTGKWNIKSEKGNLSGCFTLVMKKINAAWVIVSDHSS